MQKNTLSSIKKEMRPRRKKRKIRLVQRNVAPKEEERNRCPILLEFLDEMPPEEREKLPCGHEFNKAALKSALTEASRCPVCRIPLQSVSTDPRVGIMESAGITVPDHVVLAERNENEFFLQNQVNFGPVQMQMQLQQYFLDSFTNEQPQPQSPDFVRDQSAYFTNLLCIDPPAPTNIFDRLINALSIQVVDAQATVIDRQAMVESSIAIPAIPSQNLFDIPLHDMNDFFSVLEDRFASVKDVLEFKPFPWEHEIERETRNRKEAHRLRMEAIANNGSFFAGNNLDRPIKNYMKKLMDAQEQEAFNKSLHKYAFYCNKWQVDPHAVDIFAINSQLTANPNEELLGRKIQYLQCTATRKQLERKVHNLELGNLVFNMLFCLIAFLLLKCATLAIAGAFKEFFSLSLFPWKRKSMITRGSIQLITGLWLFVTAMGLLLFFQKVPCFATNKAYTQAISLCKQHLCEKCVSYYDYSSFTGKREEIVREIMRGISAST